jgi:hypothetical protein
MSVNSVKDFIETKLRSTNREGIEDLITFLEENDYFTAPASTRYHGAYPGGLAEHCVNVLDAMMALDDMLNTVYGMPKCNEDSIILVALLHDLTKVNFYGIEKKWRKDENNKWEQYDAYVWNPDYEMGHSAKSIWVASKYIKLTDEEAQAIFWHMGAYDVSNYNSLNALSNAFGKNPLAYKLHTADMMATHVLENENIEWEDKEQQ